MAHDVFAVGCLIYFGFGFFGSEQPVKFCFVRQEGVECGKRGEFLAQVLLCLVAFGDLMSDLNSDIRFFLNFVDTFLWLGCLYNRRQC